MKYTIRPEYLSQWSSFASEASIITENDLVFLSAEWNKPTEELLEQLDEYTADNIVMVYGEPVDFDAAVNLMDDEIREDLHAEGIGKKQDFINEYCKRHLAKYHTAFCI